MLLVFVVEHVKYVVKLYWVVGIDIEIRNMAPRNCIIFKVEMSIFQLPVLRLLVWCTCCIKLNTKTDILI